MISLDAHLAALSSPDLLAALDRTAAQGREVTADLIALLTECDARQLHVEEGYASLFAFCVARLRLSEAQAYHRIQAARAARRFPLVLERLREGRVTLTAVALLREHLTESTHREVLDWAEGRGKREVEGFIRRLDPQPDVRSSLRRLAPPRLAPLKAIAAERQPSERALLSESAIRADVAPSTATTLPLCPAHPRPVSAAPAWPGPSEGGHAAPEDSASAVATVPGLPALVSRSEIRPLAPARYSLHVTISEDTHDKLRRAQDLLRHVIPTADAALVLDRALTLLVEQLERRKAGAPAQQRATKTKSEKAATRPPRPAQGPGLHERRETDATNDQAAKRGRSDAPDTVAVAPPTATPMPSPHRRARYIPAPVRRAVWDREGGRCSYVSPSGVRCTATARLEYHHRVPFAEGGPSTVENVSLRCRRHNALEAERWFNCDRTEFGRQAEHRGVSETPVAP